MKQYVRMQLCHIRISMNVNSQYDSECKGMKQFWSQFEDIKDYLRLTLE